MSTAFATSVEDLHYEPDCSQEQVEQVLSALSRWSERTQHHVNHTRGIVRHDYRAEITIERTWALAPDMPATRQVLHVRTRNLSTGGVGFVAPPFFAPVLLSDTTPILRTEDVFPLAAQVGLRFDQSGAPGVVLRGVVARIRAVHFGFYEVGIRLVARS